MKALVAYESFFGNTKTIGDAIARGLTQNHEVTVKPTQDLSDIDFMQHDIIVIGSATRGFRPSPETQKVLFILKSKTLSGKHVAAFDTRIKLETIDSRFLRFIVDLGGYAASKILKKLVSSGGIKFCKPEGFLVLDKEGPLEKGEVGRAEKWGSKIKA